MIDKKVVEAKIRRQAYIAEIARIKEEIESLQAKEEIYQKLIITLDSIIPSEEIDNNQKRRSRFRRRAFSKRTLKQIVSEIGSGNANQIWTPESISRAIAEGGYQVKTKVKLSAAINNILLIDKKHWERVERGLYKYIENNKAGHVA